MISVCVCVQALHSGASTTKIGTQYSGLQPLAPCIVSNCYDVSPLTGLNEVSDHVTKCLLSSISEAFVRCIMVDMQILEHVACLHGCLHSGEWG